MTRKQKALLVPFNRVVMSDVQTKLSDGTWEYCCPASINCGHDDIDPDTADIKDGHCFGCRGVTCLECWEAEA